MPPPPPDDFEDEHLFAAEFGGDPPPERPAAAPGSGPTRSELRAQRARASTPRAGRRAARPARGPAGDDESTPPASPDPASPPARWPMAVSGGLYLVLAVAVWWNVWSGHPAGTSTCECGDPSLFISFFEWPAYALIHGHSFLYSSTEFHGRGGINLLANTSELGLSVPLIPVTLLFGPVASLNVAVTLAPALSALSMYWLVRRWVRWSPASFCAGLLFGFSPFALFNGAYAHLMLTFLVVPPLVVACLDELIVRRRHRPWKVGAALGLLVVYQFFISTEVLVIMAVSLVFALVVLVAYALFARPAEIGRRLPGLARGLGTGAAVSGGLLAYPAWFALAGPAHFSGAVWPTLGAEGGWVWNMFFHTGNAPGTDVLAQVFGYLGTPMPQQAYLGWGIPIALGFGLIAFRHDLRLWFFGLLGVFALVCSLGRIGVQPSIWWVVAKLPLFDDVAEQRFSIVISLCVAVMLALVMEHCHDAVAARLRPETLPPSNAPRGVTGAVAGGTPPEPRRAPGWLAVGPVLAGLVAGAVALVPMAQALAPTLPYAVEPDYVPAWFTTAAPHLGPGQVVLAYPAPFSLLEGALTWQALGNRDQYYLLAGGAGPEADLSRAGSQRAGQQVLDDLSAGVVQEYGTPAEFAQVRSVLRAWGVTMVVVPRLQVGNRLFSGTSPAYAAGFFTAALGRPPVWTDQAWVWRDVPRSGPALVLPKNTVARCGNKAQAALDGPPMFVPDCVVAGSRQLSRST